MGRVKSYPTRNELIKPLDITTCKQLPLHASHVETLNNLNLKKRFFNLFLTPLICMHSMYVSINKFGHSFIFWT